MLTFSICKLQQFPNLEFIVQDINPVMLTQGPKLPAFDQVQERVSFMQYDFCTPQPIQHAGLFLLRQVLHNYNDDKCVTILRSFVPALEKSAPGTGILINDMVLPAANTKPKVEEHALRQLDMAMLGGYAAKQRTLNEFKGLLEKADSRFKVGAPTFSACCLTLIQCISWPRYMVKGLWGCWKFNLNAS